MISGCCITYSYIQCNRIFIFHAHHTPLRSHFADHGHPFVAKRQVHSRHCGKDNASTIFKWIKIIDNFYYN